MKAFSYILLISFVLILVYAANELPTRGDPNAPINRDSSLAGTPGATAHYIRNAEKDMKTPNVVTSILADYRGYDTLGETTVIFCAGIVVFLILRKQKDGSKV